MKYTEEYWSKRLEGVKSINVKNAIKKVYESYPKECMPQGICDPLYIMNTIALEVGIGDGKGDFYVK